MCVCVSSALLLLHPLSNTHRQTRQATSPSTASLPFKAVEDEGIVWAMVVSLSFSLLAYTKSSHGRRTPFVLLFAAFPSITTTAGNVCSLRSSSSQLLDKPPTEHQALVIDYPPLNGPFLISFFYQLQNSWEKLKRAKPIDSIDSSSSALDRSSSHGSFHRHLSLLITHNNNRLSLSMMYSTSCCCCCCSSPVDGVIQ